MLKVNYVQINVLEKYRTLDQETYFVVVQLLSWVRLLGPHRLKPARLLCPGDFPGKNTGVGCHLLLQGIFLTQELNLRLLH